MVDIWCHFCLSVYLKVEVNTLFPVSFHVFNWCSLTKHFQYFDRRKWHTGTHIHLWRGRRCALEQRCMTHLPLFASLSFSSFVGGITIGRRSWVGIQMEMEQARWQIWQRCYTRKCGETEVVLSLQEFSGKITLGNICMNASNQVLSRSSSFILDSLFLCWLNSFLPQSILSESCEMSNIRENYKWAKCFFCEQWSIMF